MPIAGPYVPSASGAAFATVTEAEILRGRVQDLEKAVEALKEQNEDLRRQLVALRDGVWLDPG